MKRMLAREAQGANPRWGVLFQDPFYGALWGAYTACCPSFSGRTAPIGCPRHGGVRLGLWMTESMGWDQRRYRSLNICPPSFPRSCITAGTSGETGLFFCEDTEAPCGMRSEIPVGLNLQQAFEGWHKVILHRRCFYRAKPSQINTAGPQPPTKCFLKIQRRPHCLVSRRGGEAYGRDSRDWLLVGAEGWYMGQSELHENANIMGGLKAKQIACWKTLANMQHQQ